jgi:Short C-terminal domain
MQQDGVTFIAKGSGGQLVVTPQKVIIQRKGLLGVMQQRGDKEIRLDQISAIQLKKPGLTAGFCRLSFVGGQEGKAPTAFGAADDQNAILIQHGQYGEFEQAKALIEQYQQAMAQAQRAPVVVQAPVSAADELEKLAALRDRGILSEEEFAAKKRQILGL